MFQDGTEKVMGKLWKSTRKLPEKYQESTRNVQKEVPQNLS